MLGQVSCVVTAWKGYILVGATWTLLGQVFCRTLLGPGVTWMLLGQVSYASNSDAARADLISWWGGWFLV